MTHRVAMRPGGIDGLVHVPVASVAFYEARGYRRVDDPLSVPAAEVTEEAKSDGVRKSGGRRRSARKTAD